MSRVDIRPATSEDFTRFYGNPAPWTIRGVVVTVDDNPVAFGGYYLREGHAFVFTDVKEEGRSYRWALYKGAKAVMGMAGKTGLPMMAAADPDEETSIKALVHFGFGYSHMQDDTHIWRRDG